MNRGAFFAFGPCGGAGMFVPFDEGWPPPPRWEPRPERPRLSKRDEGRLLWLIGVNLLLLFVAPLAGVSVLQVIAALWGG